MIHSYVGDSTFYDVNEFTKKYLGYNQNKNTILFSKLEKKFEAMNKELNQMSETKPEKICTFLFGILNLIQGIKQKDLFEHELMKKFIDKTVDYLKENYKFEKNYDPLNFEMEYALNNFPNYDLSNNYITVEEAENMLQSKLSLSKCCSYLVGTLDDKHGCHFPEMYIPTSDLIKLGAIESDEMFGTFKYHRVQIVAINK